MTAVHDWKKNKTSQNTIQKKNHTIILNGNNRFTKTILRNLKDTEMLKILGLTQRPVTNEMMKKIGTSHSNIYRKVQALTDSMMLVRTGFHQDSNKNNSSNRHSWEYVRSFDSIFVRYDCEKRRNDDGICHVSPSIIVALDRKNYYKIHIAVRDEKGGGGGVI